ncbi:tRNA lysidine(34) synthetase TilS [Halobacillus litoralis]|uniref:tRNA lysidine(34) synthetase TilS n=1 Tax=Halobacillus litoralis TaxID=45668 RepID=UPI001CFF1F4B|nr:tRNA lysidine(34) synthetase TilS [Halobacillus litoralis]
MDQTVHSFISKHGLIQPHQVLLVAVSGGPDSIALLHFLKSLRRQIPLRIIALSVDHGLRGEESKEDLRFVKKTCKQWEVEFLGTSVDVKSYKESTGKGTQEAARDLRYQFFSKMMYVYGGDALVLGHHGDDQAETVLMQMTRSARPEAVHGMPVQRSFADGKIIRPFLCVSKDQIFAYLEKHRIEVRMDPSNNETDYTRNAFRHHVLPFMKEQNPKFHQHMQAWSERVEEERVYINEQAQNVLKEVHFSKDVEKFAHFSIQTFKTFPLALQRTAFHLILNYLYVKQNEDISYIHEEMFMNLLDEEKPNASLDFPQGLKIKRAYDKVTFTFAEDKEADTFHQLFHVGEAVELPDGSRLESQWSCSYEEDPYVYVCDENHVKLPLILRTRQKGDRIRVRGMNGSKKVKDIFIDQKIPAHLRDMWPIVTDQTGKILWVVGLKKGGDPAGLSSSGTWLRLHYKNKAET